MTEQAAVSTTAPAAVSGFGKGPLAAASRPARPSARRLGPVDLVPWTAIALVYLLWPGQAPFAAQVLVLILFALSLDLVLGHAGIVTLGHAAFFGLGAYTVGMLNVHLGWREPLTALAAGGAVAGAVGVLSGVLLLRYSGLPLLMLTLATSAMLLELANYRSDLTGGFDGLSGIDPAPLFGTVAFDFSGKTQLLYAAAVLLVCFVFVRRLTASPFGQTLRGIRDNRRRMEAVGTPVFGHLLAVYGVSALLAGISGALFAQVNAYVTLDVLSFERSGGVMVMLAIAGLARPYGAMTGATLYAVIEHYLANVSPEFWEFGLGVALILIVLFARGGLLPTIERQVTRRSGRARQ